MCGEYLTPRSGKAHLGRPAAKPGAEGVRVETGRVPLDRVFLPVLGLDDAVEVVPTDAKTVAARMISSLEFERARLTVAYQQFRFAFPDRANPLLDTIRDRELALLTDALADLPAYEIRHPYPVPQRGVGLHAVQGEGQTHHGNRHQREGALVPMLVHC